MRLNLIDLTVYRLGILEKMVIRGQISITDFVRYRVAFAREVFMAYPELRSEFVSRCIFSRSDQFYFWAVNGERGLSDDFPF